MVVVADKGGRNRRPGRVVTRVLQRDPFPGAAGESDAERDAAAPRDNRGGRCDQQDGFRRSHLERVRLRVRKRYRRGHADRGRDQRVARRLIVDAAALECRDSGDRGCVEPAGARKDPADRVGAIDSLTVAAMPLVIVLPSASAMATWSSGENGLPAATDDGVARKTSRAGRPTTARSGVSAANVIALVPVTAAAFAG